MRWSNIRRPKVFVDKSVENVDKCLGSASRNPSSRMGKVSLGIFAKDPVPGTVKTRLCPPLSIREAAELYRISLEETIGNMAGAGVDLTLFYAGGESFFRNTFPGIAREPQRGDCLGERMENALALLLSKGARAAALIGSDSPDLPLSLVCEAFESLEKDEVVTVPAADGGYILIGECRHVPELFRDMVWSTDRVLAETRARAQRYGIRYWEVGRWEDVDDLRALQRLVQRSPQSVTAQYASKYLGHCLDLSLEI